MRLARSAEELIAHPVGAALVGGQFVLWSRDAARAGTVAWGRIDEAEARRIAAAWDYEARLDAPYSAVVNLSGLEGVEPAAFDVVARDMSARLPALARRIRRQALVRPPGMPGALVAGFYPTLAPAFEWRDFASAAEAYAWCWPDDGAALLAEVAALVAQARASTQLLERVRAQLAQRLASPPRLPALAAALACSTRTLQRALAGAGTSYRVEIQRARVARARALLETSDAKLDLVARQVGFASTPSFIACFTRVTGESPTAFRARRR